MNHLTKIYQRIRCKILRNLGDPRKLADYLYYIELGHKINWEHPEDLNQWINWLAFNTDTTEWSRLSDKYAVREYVKECGLGDTLVPLLAVWDSPEQINFPELPERFVIKANNGSGDVRVITDKSKANLGEIKSYFRSLFSHPFGIDTAEPHYLRIIPRIIVEKMLDASSQATQSSSLIDYKIWCIHGEPVYIKAYLNRTKGKTEMAGFDTEWNRREDIDAYSDHFVKPSGNVKRPLHLDEMLQYARRLAKGFPEVRVDFYEVDGKVYFGEMTFTGSCGRITSFSESAQKELGNLIAKKYF